MNDCPRQNPAYRLAHHSFFDRYILRGYSNPFFISQNGLEVKVDSSFRVYRAVFT